MSTYEGWAVVELFGQRTLKAKVTEALLAGERVLRIEIPEWARVINPFTSRPLQFFLPRSLFGLTEVTEDELRTEAAEQVARETRHQLSVPPAPAEAASEVVEDDDDRFDDEIDDDEDRFDEEDVSP